MHNQLTKHMHVTFDQLAARQDNWQSAAHTCLT